MKYKLINKQTGKEHLCDKVKVDGFDYYYIDEIIPYNPNGGTNGDFVCLSEIISNEERKVKKGDKTYISPFVKNVGSCGGCRKLIATNNQDSDIPKVVDEVEKLAESIILNLPYKKYVKTGFIGGYNKSQETHPFSKDDMVDFYEWCDTSEEASRFWRVNRIIPTMDNSHLIKIKEKRKELFQIWEEQRFKIVYYE